VHPRTGRLIVTSRQRDLYADAARDRRMNAESFEADELRRRTTADAQSSRTAPGGIRVAMRNLLAVIFPIV